MASVPARPETLVRYAWFASVAAGRTVADVTADALVGAPVLLAAGAARVVAVVPAGAGETATAICPDGVEVVEGTDAVDHDAFDLVIGPGITPPPGVPDALLAAGRALLEASTGAEAALAVVRGERALLRDERAREDELRVLRAALEASEAQAMRVAEQEVELHLLRRRAESAEAEIIATREALERLAFAEKALADINGSLSWRLTAPLRRWRS